MTLNEFIDKVGMIAVGYYPKYKILPSLCIAQALLESNKISYKQGLQLSGLAKECHNYFGMKWSSDCGCEYKAYTTREQLANGNYITIVSKFRKYRTMEEGIEGYFKFLTYKRYKNLQGVTDWKLATELIKLDGWATSHKYTENLQARIQYLSLWKYDEIALGKREPQKISTENIPILKRGMRDSQLKANYIESWQRYLSLIGFKCGIDGIFGAETEKQVNAYRKSLGLPQTGVVDQTLWNTVPR